MNTWSICSYNNIHFLTILLIVFRHFDRLNWSKRHLVAFFVLLAFSFGIIWISILLGLPGVWLGFNRDDNFEPLYVQFNLFISTVILINKIINRISTRSFIKIDRFGSLKKFEFKNIFTCECCKCLSGFFKKNFSSNRKIGIFAEKLQSQVLSVS